MQTISKAEIIPYPSAEVVDNFKFDCSTEGGNFSFNFKWLNDRWNLWVTLPDGSVRQAGTEPGVISWSEFDDYGLVIQTDMETINHNSILQTELVLITWL